MDIANFTRNKVISEVFKFGATKGDWRIFIYNERTAPLLSNLFSITDILEYEILILQRLESKRDALGHSAIYFVEIDSNSFKMLKDDIKRKKYLFYYIISSNRNAYSSKFSEFENVQYKEFLISYIPVEERVFTFNKNDILEAILSLGKILNMSFTVNYHPKQESIAKKISCSFESVDKKEDLILLDRSIDLYIPLIHFFTFQSILEDLKIKDVPKDNDLWKTLRHVHIAEINEILSEESNKIISDIKLLSSKNINQKDLMNIAFQAPEKIKMKEVLNTYLNIVDDLFDVYENNIKPIVHIEQFLATHTAPENAGVKEFLENPHKIFSKKSITKEDKIRIFLLYGAQYDFKRFDLQNLIEMGVFTKTEIKLLDEFKKFKLEKTAESKKYKYEISRYQPALFAVLKDFINNQSSLNRIGSKNHVSISLRKTSFAFSDFRKKRFICVIFQDSVTWPEIHAVYELSKTYNFDIIIGAPKIITASDFISDLEKKYYF